jgi:hypothetical protein
MKKAIDRQIGLMAASMDTLAITSKGVPHCWLFTIKPHDWTTIHLINYPDDDCPSDLLVQGALMWLGNIDMRDYVPESCFMRILVSENSNGSLQNNTRLPLLVLSIHYQLQHHYQHTE